MKKSCFNLRQRSRWLLVSLLALLAGGSPSWADELTIADGTTTNSYTPFDAGNADYGIKGEYIIPAADLEAMSGKTITSIKLYANTNNTTSKPNYGPFQVFLKEVENATPYSSTSSAFQGMDDATIVYEGTVVVASKEMLITFNTPYDYKGGNLLIGFYKDKGGNYYSNKFYGVNQDGYTGCSSYSSSGISSIASGTGRSFIPKTTFTYEATSTYKKPATLTYTSVTSNSAVIDWTAGSSDSSETGWNLEYKTSASDTWTEVHGLGASTLSYSLTSLEANTSYDVRVQALYDENESGWKSISFKTEKISTPATGFTDNFETDKGWELINGTQTNKWVRSSATNNGGSNALYISNDGGTTNAYSHSASMTFASKLFAFEAGDFTIAYDWKANGESQYDFLRVALVPASVELTAGTTPSSFSYNGLPSGWQALDGGSKLNLQSDWQSKSVDITIESAGAYQVVFAWKNDGSGGTQTPAAAIDNFKILGSAPVLELGGDVVGTTLAFGSVNETTNKTITITNSGKVAMENITLTETSDADNVFAYTTLPKTSLDASESMDVTVTFSGSSAKDYTGTFRVSADDCDPIDVNVTATYSNSPASIAITIAEDAVGESVAFGSVGKEAVKTFTVTNDGDQTLNVTIASNNTTDFTVSPAELAVTGHSSETFTVTFVYDAENIGTEKTANITITPSNDGLSPVTFAVSATSVEMWSEDFSGNTLPEGWETTSSTDWTIADGVAKGAYQTTSYWIVTPSLIVEEGSSLNFDVYRNNVWTTLEIQMQKNNGSWESYQDISYSEITNYTWKTYTIEGLENGNYRFRFNARGYWLDNFEGFKRNMNDPKLGIYTNAECTVAAAASVTKDFGFVTEAPEAQVYYLKNDGTGTLTLTLGDVPTGFTAALGMTSLGKDESTTLTINMPVETKGYRGGNIVVTAKNSSDVALGTFTVAASGVVVDENKLNLNFATDNIPATWTANSWSKNANGYLQTSSSSNLETSKLTATAGEEIVIVAKQAYSGSSYTFGVNYKKVGAAEWSTLIASSSLGNSNWITLHASIAEAGDYLFQFVGYYAQIQRIYGLSVPQEPVMVVYDGESLAAATYNFGNVSDEADATWTLTVKNEGKAELTGLAAALTGDNADHYSVEVSAETVAVNGTATITVTQLKDYVGAHAATLTISATGLDNKVIALSGNTYDHNKLFVDFENNAFPAGWSVGTSWTVTTPYSSTAHHAQQSSFSTASALTTTPLTVGENEKLTFDAARLYSSSTPELKVRYTTNGGITWSEYVDFASQVTTSDYVKLELTDVPAGTAIVEFYGRYIKIDNIYGFTPTTAPVMALTESNVAVENGSTKEFGTLTAAATATYVLSNTGNGDLVSTLSSDVVTFEVTSMGEDVTLSENTLTIPAGKSATIVVTMPYAAPFEAKNGSLTITSTGWVAPVTLNYTATLNDPTALYEDFAGNAKPAGWYQEASGWLFTQGAAHVNTGVDKEIITEKYGAEDGKNVLSFDAKRQSTSLDGELKVYTSNDRQEWTLAKTVTLTAESQTVTLDALADGEYYVKFVSLNASIDNLAGLKKLTAPEHDLYVTATTFPTTTLIPETENGVSASATVYSLRADETGVVAKLFFDEEEVATVTHSVNVNGYYTFSLTCNVPAEEKTYAAKIVVYYSDETVAWESQTTNVVVSQTRTLQITDFARTSDETVDADANNQFTSTFNVTVNNNGTVAQDAANVSVSITDADGNVIGENATSWTVANSQTMFIVPGEYANDNAVLAIYRFNTNEDAEWAELTKISDNFYSAELNNKTKFIVVRLKNSEVEGYDATNNGLNWANKWNQSVDITPGTANCFTFNGWDDKDGDNHYFGYSTMAELAKGVSTTLKVTVTTSALEGGEFTFKAKENMSNTVSTASATVTVTAAAPKFEMALGSEGLANGDAVAYGIVKEATAKTFTISNTGNKDLELVSIAAPEGFTATAVTEENKTIDVDGTLDIDVMLNADQGKVSGDLVITYKVDATTNKTFTLALSGRSISDDTWAVDFEDGSIPANWDNSNGWAIDETDGNNVARLTGWDAKAIITPRLVAEKDDILTFDVLSLGHSISYAYSTDRKNWSDEVPVTATGEQTFTAPAAGNYYLRITARNAYIDNFVGFKLNPNTFELDETVEPELAEDFYETLTLKRTFNAGWNTVCLPFAISSVTAVFGENAKAYDFTGYSTSEGTLDFEVTTALEAGKPYIVYVENAITAPIILSNTTVTSTTASSTEWNGVSFLGTYAPVAKGSMTGMYGVTSDGYIKPAGSGASIKGFRAYFDVPAGIEVKALLFDGEIADGVKTIDNGQQTTDAPVYNMSGQRIQKMQKGINIVSGKKILK